MIKDTYEPPVAIELGDFRIETAFGDGHAAEGVWFFWHEW